MLLCVSSLYSLFNDISVQFFFSLYCVVLYLKTSNAGGNDMVRENTCYFLYVIITWTICHTALKIDSRMSNNTQLKAMDEFEASTYEKKYNNDTNVFLKEIL